MGTCCSKDAVVVSQPTVPPMEKPTTDDELPKYIGPLTENEIASRIEMPPSQQTVDLGLFQLRYAYLSQRGYYPESLQKANQDAYCVHTNFCGDNSIALFSVFDGHGGVGDACAQFARDTLPQVMKKKIKKTMTEEELKRAFVEAHVETNRMLHEAPIDDSMSGTTAVSVLFINDTIHVLNVGDSRAIVAQDIGQNGANVPGSNRKSMKLKAKPLSVDQTPFRKDERDRVKKYGARVLTVDQLEGYEPIHEDWGVTLGEEIDESGDPPRIWHPVGDYPGTAFTRSIGDAVSEELGVIPDPEILSKQLNLRDKFIVIASDGVFEFLTSQTVVEIVNKYSDPLLACRAVVTEAYNLWLQYEVRTDDITVIVVFLEGVTSRRDDHRGSIVGGADLLRYESFMRPVRHVGGKTGARRRDTIMGQDAMRFTLSDEYADSQEWTPGPIESKSKEQEAKIRRALKQTFLFQNLSNEQLRELIDQMQFEETDAAEVVIRQGTRDSKFYVVDHGEYELRIKSDDSLKDDDEKDAANAGDSLDATFGRVAHVYTSNAPSCSFGELALMYSKLRKFSVISRGRGALWSIDRAAFRNVNTKRKDQDQVSILRKVEVLKSLSMPQLQQLAEHLQQIRFKDGDKIITKGEEGTQFYIVTSGQVAVYTEEGTQGTGRGTELVLKEGDYFGERALLTGEARAATVIAKGETTCLYINREAFEKFLGPLRHLMDTDHRRRRMLDDFKHRKVIAKEPLHFVSALGLGSDAAGDEESTLGWGPRQLALIAVTMTQSTQALLLVQRREDGGVRVTANGEAHDNLPTAEHTLKVLNVPRCMAENAEGTVMGERELLMALAEEPNPFLPKLEGTVIVEHEAYMLLQGSVVADLATVLASKPLDEAKARLVAAQVVSALGTLHKLGYVCRSLSPEMIGVTKQGHLLFPNLRMSKYVGTGRTYTLCGSPGYLAPEQVVGKGHGQAADLWALGVLIVDLLTAEAPFDQPDKEEIDIYQQLATYKKDNLSLPPSLSEGAASLVRCLLDEVPERRLGADTTASSASSQDRGHLAPLREHAWFNGIDWTFTSGEDEGPLSGLVTPLYESLVKEVSAGEAEWVTSALVQRIFKEEESSREVEAADIKASDQADTSWLANF